MDSFFLFILVGFAFVFAFIVSSRRGSDTAIPVISLLITIVICVGIYSVFFSESNPDEGRSFLDILFEPPEPEPEPINKTDCINDLIDIGYEVESAEQLCHVREKNK